MQRRPIRPPDLNGPFLTAIKRACREARGRPIRRLRRLPRLWACSRPPSRRPRPPRRWARPPGRAERGFGGFGCPPVLTRGGGISGGGRGDAGRGAPARGRNRAIAQGADQKFFSLDLVQDLLRNSAEKQASPASTAFAPPPWAVSKGFAHPTQTQLVFLDLAVPSKSWRGLKRAITP